MSPIAVVNRHVVPAVHDVALSQSRVDDRTDAAGRFGPLLNNRWTAAAAATIFMMCLGTVYSFSLFTRPLIAAFHWTTMAAMWGFSIAIFSLGIGAVVGGRWQDRLGPRRVALSGAALWGAGNILAGLLTPHCGPLALYLSYGAVGGFGLGMGYVSPVAMVTKWFPDRRGFASGLVLTGFGLGALMYNGIVSTVPAFALAVRHAGGTPGWASPADVSALMATFVWSGAAFVIIAPLCALVLRDPPAGYGRRCHDPEPALCREYRPREVLRSPQFYMLWSMLFFSVTAGILIISNAVPIYSDLTGLATLTAAPICGALAVFNGIGRIVCGHLSDRLGRGNAYALILGTQAVVFFALPHLHGPAAVGAAFAIVLFCNGGSFGTMPAYNAEFFGTKHLGTNYGMILTAWGCAGLMGPLLAAEAKDLTGSYGGTLLPIAMMLLAAMALPLLARRPADRAGAYAGAAR
ncbi:MAG: OFA family MFS transporter [Candidatus Velthaea sp.]